MKRTLTQQEYADRIGVSRSTVAAWLAASDDGQVLIGGGVVRADPRHNIERKWIEVDDPPQTEADR